jgi:hypothetical protein
VKATVEADEGLFVVTCHRPSSHFFLHPFVEELEKAIKKAKAINFPYNSIYEKAQIKLSEFKAEVDAKEMKKKIVRFF